MSVMLYGFMLLGIRIQSEMPLNSRDEVSYSEAPEQDRDEAETRDSLSTPI